MIKYTLQHPVEHEGEQITELKFPRRSTARDQIAISRMAREQGYTAEDLLGVTACSIAQLSGLPLDAVLSLDTVDFNGASEEIQDFFTGAPTKRK